MKKTLALLMSLALLVAGMTFALFPDDAFARAGGKKSMGNRGSRSYTTPQKSTPAQQPAQPMEQRRAAAPTAPMQAAPAQPASGFMGGGFMKGMLGGIAGGLIGGMLFRSLGFGATPAGGVAGAPAAAGGGGIGIFEILLIGGIIYLIYRLVRKKKETAPYAQGFTSTDYDYGREQVQAPDRAGYDYPPSSASSAYPVEDSGKGLQYIAQMDPSFDESRFTERATDMFFKIQSAWMHRDLSIAADLLTTDMRETLQRELDELIRNKRINKLDNVAMRNHEITEAWQEGGQDYITLLITANLLDYTIDEASGAVVDGSDREPVKFEEFWTFTRPLGNNPWKLSAINQVQ